ncbi:Protein of unknown function [Gryllus bimaculatus]|nr:Protein of unknown function [Gryllus bimaculatus]
MKSHPTLLMLRSKTNGIPRGECSRSSKQPVHRRVRPESWELKVPRKQPQNLHFSSKLKLSLLAENSKDNALQSTEQMIGRSRNGPIGLTHNDDDDDDDGGGESIPLFASSHPAI